MNQNRVRWGILSTARFGTDTFVPAMQRGEWTEVAAIASRDYEKAQAAARRLGIPKAYGSYEELLADPELEAIYNPLPNHLHVPWSIRALEAGKHVLTEKPIALNAREAGQLAAAARARPELLVMEAFMYRSHPQWEPVHRLIREGTIGGLQSVHTTFCYFNQDPADIRNQTQAGGGGLLDIGCYAISVSRWVFGSEPRRVLGGLELDPRFGTDRQASAILEFDAGTGTFTVATQLASYQRVTVHGTRGWIEVEIPFNPLPDLPSHVSYRAGRDIVPTRIEVEPANQYTILVDQFSEAVQGRRPLATPLADGVANMKVIDAVFASAASGGWAEC